MEILSEYLQTDHRLSRVDPRLKLGTALILLVLVLTHQGFGFPLLIAGGSAVLLLQMRIPFQVYLLRLLEPLFIILMLVLLKTFFTGREVLASVSFWGFTLAAHQDGLLEGLRLGARIIGAVSIVTTLSFCTSFTQFMAGLSWFKVPQVLIEILLFAYRYIFVLLEEAQVIYQAQKNRFGYVTAARGLQSFGTLTGSLILKVFEHSQNVSVAMVQRGYDGNLPLLKHRSFKRGEILASCAWLALFGILWKITA
jgi:cobalt/nickel transport system permease protein